MSSLEDSGSDSAPRQYHSLLSCTTCRLHASTSLPAALTALRSAAGHHTAARDGLIRCCCGDLGSDLMLSGLKSEPHPPYQRDITVRTERLLESIGDTRGYIYPGCMECTVCSSKSIIQSASFLTHVIITTNGRVESAHMLFAATTDSQTQHGPPHVYVYRVSGEGVAADDLPAPLQLMPLESAHCLDQA